MDFHLFSKRTFHGETNPNQTEPVSVDRRPAGGSESSSDGTLGEARMTSDRPRAGSALLLRERTAGQADAADGGAYDPETPVRPLRRSGGLGAS